jgi:hypothetical protein
MAEHSAHTAELSRAEAKAPRAQRIGGDINGTSRETSNNLVERQARWNWPGGCMRYSAFLRSSVRQRSPSAKALYLNPRPCATFNGDARLSALTKVRREAKSSEARVGEEPGSLVDALRSIEVTLKAGICSAITAENGAAAGYVVQPLMY